MLDTTTILFLSLNLMTLGASHKGNHTVSVPVWLAYFTEHTVLKVHPCCSALSVPPSFLPKAEKYSIVCTDHAVFISPPAHEHLGCFHLWAVKKAAAINMGIQVSALRPNEVVSHSIWMCTVLRTSDIQPSFHMLTGHLLSSLEKRLLKSLRPTVSTPLPPLPRVTSTPVFTGSLQVL